MATCCVTGCTSKRTPPQKKDCSRGISLDASCDQISFHSVPVKEALRSLWLLALKKHNPLFAVTDYSAVCSLHFTPLDYRLDTRKRTLLPKSVPSVFPRYPSPFETSNSKSTNTGSEDAVSCSVAEKEVQLPLSHSKKNKKSVQGRISSTSITTYTRSIGIQVESLPTGRLDVLKAENNRLRSKHYRLSETLKTLSDTLEANQEIYNNAREYHVIKILKESPLNDTNSLILIDQINNFQKTQPCWSNATLAECLEWRNVDTKSYEYARNAQLLTLPCRVTLERFAKGKIPCRNFPPKSKKRHTKNNQFASHTIIIKESPILGVSIDPPEAYIVKNSKASKCKNLRIPFYESLIEDPVHAVVIEDINKPEPAEITSFLIQQDTPSAFSVLNVEDEAIGNIAGFYLPPEIINQTFVPLNLDESLLNSGVAIVDPTLSDVHMNVSAIDEEFVTCNVVL